MYIVDKEGAAIRVAMELLTEVGATEHAILDTVNVQWNMETGQAKITWQCSADLPTAKVVEVLNQAGVTGWEDIEVEGT